jgi:uncharacterized protein YjiS (DUF1127 family)
MLLISKLTSWLERSRLRQELLRRDNRLLADIGVSRTLLEGGVRAWPWLTPTEPRAEFGQFASNHEVTQADYARAVAELEAASDAELRDLGLTRGGIAEAVHHGRPGFPEDQRKAA